MISSFNWERCLSYARRIWENDRLLTNAANLRTAAFVEKTMKDIGLHEVETLNARADGRTEYAEWIIPQAWNVKSARLAYADGEVIADYDEIPCSLSMRSAKTPAGGVIREVVDADAQPAGEWMKDKLLFTARSADKLVKDALQYGAAGVISDYFPLYEGVRGSREEMKGVARWDCEFMPVRNDTHLFAFNLTPERGDRLRARLHGGERIRLHAQVDAELFDGYAPTVSGCIPGTSPELGEILLYGHLYEPGANDNASGCALMLECMNIYMSLINSGAVEPPKRTIRLALGQECMGSTAYLLAHPERKTVICLDADMIGTESVDNAVFGVWHSPYSNWSFLDDLIEETVEAAQALGAFKWRSRPFGIASDNMLGDPSFNMPTVALITEPALSYHTSMDTPDRLEENVLRRNTWILLHMIRILAEADAQNPISLTYSYTHKKLAAASSPLEKAFWEAQLSFIPEEARAFLRGEAARPDLTALPFPAPDADIEPIRVIRLKRGCMTLPKTDPISSRTFHTAWNTTAHRPLFWADERRTLWEIACLCAMEEGRSDVRAAYEEYLPLFRALEAGGIVRLEKA
ncbi:MAG: DUF4910 domain-containing protein [Clostridia bacterium]|nr:DUF4910 domain-containing protein [Clostridia bacterium]